MHSTTALAIKLAQAGGEMAKKAFLDHNVASQHKADGSYLTKHDAQIEKYIRQEITNQFPEHSIHGEEMTDLDNQGQYTWLIDPIEGTTNFVSGISYFCTMIAIIQDNQVVSAVIHNPFSQNTIWAERGSGAYVNDAILTAKRFNSLSQCTLILDSGRNPLKRQIAGAYLAKNCNLYRSFRHYGSVESPADFIASHQPLTTLILGIKDYDIAALSLILTESGCSVFDLKGRPWHLDKVTDFIACSPGLEKQLLATLKI